MLSLDSKITHYAQLIFDKGAKTMQFQQKVLEQLKIHRWKKSEKPWTKSHTKIEIDLNVNAFITREKVLKLVIDVLPSRHRKSKSKLNWKQAERRK